MSLSYFLSRRIPMITRTHHRFSVAEYEEMVARGILTEEDRVELIHGEILAKMTIGDRHAACVNRLTRLLVRLAGDRAIVSVQNPIRLDDSIPEPDIALLRSRDDFYASAKPTAPDVLLVIEVADTSLEFDRTEKASLYARSGISEYWLINLIDNALEQRTSPDTAQATYTRCEIHNQGGIVDTVAIPGVSVRIDEIL